MKCLNFCSIIAFVLVAGSCLREQDPGPLQSDERNYNYLDFDRLEMGDSFIITVTQSPVYSLVIRGDRRNLDDLIVSKLGSTLKVAFPNNYPRDHATFITISMPSFRGASFSGASSSTITGFKSDALDLVLTGASVSQLNVESKQSNVNLSGASRLTLSGKGETMTAKVSGASELYAYDFTVSAVETDASGASKVNVFASSSLKATASGASLIYYKGNPVVTTSTSGASSVISEN